MRIRRSISQAGYNMVILVIAVTVLNVLLAIALPKWGYLIQRDKEEELRSRGLQYAEAIRVFQMRFGRLPVRLEELIEVKPRSIRQLYDDPMTRNGEWGIIFQQMGNPRPNPNDPNAPPQQQQLNRRNPGTTLSAPTELGGGTGLDGKKVTIGPIVGVHSLSKEESLSSFFGNASYDRWLFTADLLQRTTMRPGTEQNFPRFDLANLGRPFRDGLDPLLNQSPGFAGGPPQKDGSVPGLPAGVGQGPGTGGQAPAGGIPGVGQPRPRGTGGFPTGGGVPGGGGNGGSAQPGFPGQPGFTGQPGFPGQPGSPGGGSGNGGGTPPGGFDPTQPTNASPFGSFAPPAQ